MKLLVIPLPENQFIFDLPLQLFKDPEIMLRNIFNHIKNNTDNVAAIPLNALVIKIKKTYSSEFEVCNRLGDNDSIDIKSVMNKAKQITFNKLENSYLKKNKLDEDESLAIREALEKITVDLRDGGINTGLHTYLVKEFPSLIFDDYKLKYQNIFEYLFKILKKEIVRQLKINFHR